ncbi:MAG: sensor histidine kinase [Clostridium thermopalmarium]|uniref:sensor histidine kinase n=1 Tax=Clostridium thermopalmarium TaxID=29373 RepID=UPI002357F475|nr:sensor histidine kinase [Clostridium thermopalmarium]MBE6043420.1 sensor histidine kinase [Clostridium thermopalmarium]
MIELIKSLFNNMGYIILIGFVVSHTNSFKNIIQKDKFQKKDLIILSCIFGAFGILGTYIGTDINGAIANTRIIGVMAGGILCGPFVGIMSGFIAGIHRYIIDFGGITAFPCAVTTITTGFLSGALYKKCKNKNEDKSSYGFIGGILMESMEMILILLLSKPFNVALDIVQHIYIPMGFTNAIGISILILLIQSIFEEKEEIAAKQAKIALEVANKTLPYFREFEGNSFDKICEIIKDSIDADAVSITDKKYVLAHIGIGSDHHIKGQEIQTEATGKVIKTGEILALTKPEQINCPHKHCQLKSAIIAPLKDGDEIVGTLKIYYSKEDAISFRNKNLAIGLSQIISTQLEISKLGKLKEMATKAEIKALQAQINPHFLFNALNTIISFVRINPGKARELIINLSTFLRYNLEAGDNFVDIYKELEQVKAYVEIEKARFGDKLNVVYNIDEDLDIKIPSLIIQPLVENSIKHGILVDSNRGTVKIDIKKINDNSVSIIIEDDGIGIPEEVINKVYENKMQENKIGICNVNNRLKYIYGKGLKIERLNRGTRVSFMVETKKG